MALTDEELAELNGPSDADLAELNDAAPVLTKTGENSWAAKAKTRPAFDSPEGQAEAAKAAKYASDKTESASRSAAQGTTLGWADNIKSAAQAAGDYVMGDAPSGLGAQFDAHQKVNEPEFAKSVDEHPAANFAGAMLTPTPDKALKAVAPAMKLTMLGRLAGGALMGGAAGAGYSKSGSDTALKDAGVGAAIGLGASGAGEALGYGASKLGNYFGGVKNQATADAARIAAEKQAAAEASAAGKYGASTQSASRDLEVMAREAEQLPDGPLKQKLAERLAGEEGLALREQVAGNKLASSGERLSEMSRLKAELEALRAAGPQNIAADEAAQLADPIKKQVAPRLAKLAYRFLPVAATGAGGLVGSAVGSPILGSGVGMALGGVTALIMGKPGTVVQNMVKSPGFRNFIGTHGEKLAEIAPLIQDAAVKGGAAVETLMAELRAKDPEVDALVKDAEGIENQSTSPASKLTDYFRGNSP